MDEPGKLGLKRRYAVRELRDLKVRIYAANWSLTFSDENAPMQRFPL
jgi:hypothetical protein